MKRFDRFDYFRSAWPHLFAIEYSASPGLVCIAAACPQPSVQIGRVGTYTLCVSLCYPARGLPRTQRSKIMEDQQQKYTTF